MQIRSRFLSPLFALFALFALFLSYIILGCASSTDLDTPHGLSKTHSEKPQSDSSKVILALPKNETTPSSDISKKSNLLPPSWPHQIPVEVPAKHGMVVTDAALASKVGNDILAKGGNAVDASIATAFALAVVYPGAGNIGGGGFLVARINGKPYALDFREMAPLKSHRNMFVPQRPGESLPDSVSSHRAVGVPGSVAGLYAAYQKLGSKKLSWAALLAPAIRLAEYGFIVDETFAKIVDKGRERLEKNQASKDLFLKDGNPPKIGSTWKNLELANTLKRIAQYKVAGFYRGATADLLVKEMQKHEGIISQKDLRSYQAKWREPLLFDYRGYHLISMPPPSSGGVTLAMICHILESYPLESLGWHSPKHLHFLAETMRRAFIARNSSLGDPDAVKNPLDVLLSNEWAEKQRASIALEHATPTLELTQPLPHANDGPHTTHFSVVDNQGNAVALTTTINYWFGSGITVEGAGFILNNQMDDFATNPGKPNGFGLVQGEANAIAPGKRMLSSMTPTMVLDPEGRLLLLTGAAGGPTIITAVFQIISNLVDFHFIPGQAVDAPRIHMQDFPDKVVYEKQGLTQEQLRSLESMGYKVEERERIADAPTIGVTPQGIVGAPEVRTQSSYAAGW